MKEHPTDQDLLLFRQGDDAGAASGVGEHLEGCPACRARLQAEKNFDLGLTRRLSREQAPQALLKVIQAGIGRESAQRQALRSRRWGRLVTGALAATVLAGLGLMAVWNSSSQALPGSGDEAALADSPTRSIRGQLVCVGCARAGADMAHQRACAGDGDLHVTGLQTPDGNLWRFMEGDPIRQYLHETQLRGTWLQVEARPYPAIGYLQIAAVQRL
jgi:hypothetical protein